MEFSKIANDILRIQLLTAEESEFKYESDFSPGKKVSGQNIFMCLDFDPVIKNSS